MVIWGLTGGIACGKTMVAGILREKGFTVLDADAVAREVTASGGVAEPVLMEFFGEYFDGEGRLDRRRLAAFVFNNIDAKKRLEGIVHPLVMKRLREDTDKAREAGAEVVFWDVPLLYESGMDTLCDRVLVVSADEETQIARIALRDGLSRAEALMRIENQMPISEKARRADYVIMNNGSAGNLQKKVAAFIEAEIGDKEV